MATDEEEVPAWGGAIQSAISQAGDEEDEEGVNVVSGGGLSGEGVDESGELPYVILLKQAVAGLKAGVLTEEQFVEGVSKLDVITDNALRVYAIPTVKKDLPGKLTDHQNEIVNALEVELHRLKEGLTVLLNYPNTQDQADLDSGLQTCIDAMNASRDIQKEAKIEKEAIDERKKEEKARRAQAAEAADEDESEE
ncbi:MAG: hypothetical protein KF760_00305 [Candidatus Eremiobacteraeota bacterium]|nr:hypothetical protein [Candidatus Eremiobacteraeota bacterium]MCW5871739.1 hypothetical protein [Candidatus Eremiobacteraeota bacterium]